jgi:putative transposase
MAKPRFTQQQMRAVLLEIDKGRTVKEVSEKHGISTATLYRWRSKDRDERQPTSERLRSLEVENRRLKSKFAELALDYTSLRQALLKDVRTEC